MKVTEKLSKVYNDSVFGGISWSKDSNKIVFVGEKAEITNYKNCFSDQDQEKEADKKSAGEKSKEQNDKFLYSENFGETLGTKIDPVIFIFDLSQNQLNQVYFGPSIDPLRNFP